MVAPDEFRRVLGHFATGVTILTTTDAEKRAAGLTVSAFCSVSLDPPQVLVCVDHKSQSYPALRDGGAFAVNILGKLKTVMQLVAIPFLLYDADLLGWYTRPIGQWRIVAAAALTLWSMVVYLKAAIAVPPAAR